MLKPLSLLRAGGIFLALGFVFRLLAYEGIPLLVDRGVHQFDAFLVSWTLGHMILFAVAFIMVKREGNLMTRESLSERFRLRRFGWRTLLLTIGLTIVAIVVSELVRSTQTWITDFSSWFGPPEILPPPLDPTNSAASLTDATVAWMGSGASGHWRWAIMIAVLIFFNIFGEELLWRGTLWPRQELVHGDRTWIVNGLMWNLFHLPVYPWFLLFGIPTSLLLGFVTKKTRNTWMPIIVHTLVNASFYFLVFIVVFGVID